MQPYLNGIEGEMPVDRDGQLPIQHKERHWEYVQHFQHVQKKRDSDFPDLAVSSTSRPARNATAKYVEIEPEELEAVEVESTHTIDIDTSVSGQEIKRCYERRIYRAQREDR
ncbi:MAG: hypothetical protein AB7U61_17435 [Methylocystis sp.]